MPDYAWDTLSRAQMNIVDEILGTRVQMNTRRPAAAFYVVRVKHRILALTSLFDEGNYVPAVPIIRVAYEDWLSAAWALAPGDHNREIEFMDEIGAEYARLFKRFRALCGRKAANLEFPEHPDYAKPYLESPGDPPYTKRDWRGKAVALGLQNVHDVAYNYLSELSHGSFHSFEQHVGVDENRFFEKPLVRDPERERVFAHWTFWFHLRTLTIAGREWGQDHEDVSDGWLTELHAQKKTKTFVTCVMHKERYPSGCLGAPGSGVRSKA
ncbi:MAG: DUF5677 domain-containing protein [Coriobacteriia bacterium]